jgi:hypothetical protein
MKQSEGLDNPRQQHQRHPACAMHGRHHRKSRWIEENVKRTAETFFETNCETIDIFWKVPPSHSFFLAPCRHKKMMMDDGLLSLLQVLFSSTLLTFTNMPKKKSKKNNSKSPLIDEDEEIRSLETRIEQEAPERGFAPPLSQTVAFRALPLSNATLTGLEQAKKTFTTMTEIQNACIPHALAGRDILGAARTGR